MRKQQKLQEALEEAALAGARELKRFLEGTNNDPKDARRVQVALGAVTSYTRLRASQNNMIGMVLSVSKQAGLDPNITVELAKDIGLLPESAQATSNLKAIK